MNCTIDELRDQCARGPMGEWSECKRDFSRRSAAIELELIRAKSSKTAMGSLSDRALLLAMRGLPTFSCGAKKIAKHEDDRGLHDAGTDPDRTSWRWRHHPYSLIGVLTEELSDCVVIAAIGYSCCDFNAMLSTCTSLGRMRSLRSARTQIQ